MVTTLKYEIELHILWHVVVIQVLSVTEGWKFEIVSFSVKPLSEGGRTEGQTNTILKGVLGSGPSGYNQVRDI